MKAMSVGQFNGKIGNAHALCHVTGWLGVIRNHIFVISDPNLPIHFITFYGATMTMKGSLHVSPHIVKQFSAENFLTLIRHIIARNHVV